MSQFSSPDLTQRPDWFDLLDLDDHVTFGGQP